MKEKTINILKGIGTIGLYLILSVLGAFLFGDYYYSENIVLATLSQLGTYTLMLIVLSLIYRKRLINDFKNFKKSYLTIGAKNWILGLGIMMISNILISMIIGDIASNESANRELLTNYPISNIISMILIGPLLEEITFRASFKNAFTKWYTFALFTALIFGLAHLTTNTSLIEILYLIPYGGLGFFFAKAFYETDNIYTSYLIHAVHNAICVFLILLIMWGFYGKRT